MSISFRFALLALALLALVTPAPAQQSPDALAGTLSDLLPEVVVTAPDADMVAGFVEQALPEAQGKQLARWYRPLCVSPRGFGPEQTAQVIQIVQKMAKMVGLPLARANCKPNVALLLTDDPDALIAMMLDRYPKIFAPDRPSLVRRQLRGDDAVRVWYHAASNGATGVAPEMVDVGGAGMSPQFVVAPGQTSRLAMPTRAELFRSIVILDVRKLKGRALNAVATHAAMRVLGQFGADFDSQGMPTILTLFDPDGDPVDRATALTDWDRSMLRELYTAAPTANAKQQRRAIARRMIDAPAEP